MSKPKTFAMLVFLVVLKSSFCLLTVLHRARLSQAFQYSLDSLPRHCKKVLTKISPPSSYYTHTRDHALRSGPFSPNSRLRQCQNCPAKCLVHQIFVERHTWVLSLGLVCKITICLCGKGVQAWQPKFRYLLSQSVGRVGSTLRESKSPYIFTGQRVCLAWVSSVSHCV
jgi:hypothetical protein